MSRFTKKSQLPNLKRINSTKNKVIMPIIEINETPIIEIPKIELHENPPIIDVPPVEQLITIEEPIKEVQKPESSNVTILIDDIEKKELKRKRSRELFQITVQQILLNKRKEKLEWDI